MKAWFTSRMGGKQSKAPDTSSAVTSNLQQQGKGVDDVEVDKEGVLVGSSSVSLNTKNTKLQGEQPVPKRRDGEVQQCEPRADAGRAQGRPQPGHRG